MNKGKLTLVALFVAAIACAFIFANPRQLLTDSLAWVDQQGTWAPLIFGVIYVVSAVLLIPGSILTAGAGTLFGVVKGSIIVSIASTIAAAIAFLIGRYLARKWVAKKVQSNPAFVAIDQAVAKDGWLIVGLTRLSPLFPYTVLNYAYGLTQVRFLHFVFASWIAMMPGTVMYVYLGSLARAGAHEKTPGEWALYGLGLAATIAVTVVITRTAKRALAKRTSLPPNP
jgi:uncharacterized membrane protein YdjX (TVP38/TMEM64 family)